MTGRAGRQITYESELQRKTIHLTSLLIPIIYLRVPYVTGITVLLCMAAVSLGIDVLRHKHEPTRRLLMKLVGPLLRSHERENGTLTLTGATWVLIAATLTLGAFPPAVGVTAFSVLIVSDTFAALVGRRFGKTRFLDKTVAGTATFIVTACGVVAAMGVTYSMPWTFWLAGAVGAVAAGITEASAVRLKLDDNIAIPFSMAIAMMIVDRVVRTLGEPGFADWIS